MIGSMIDGKKLGLAAAALALALSAGVLAGCGGQQQQAANEPAAAPTEQAIPADAGQATGDMAADAGQATGDMPATVTVADLKLDAAPVDTSSWKTFGDALAAEGSDMASSYDDAYYIRVFESNGRAVRVVAVMEPEVEKALNEAQSFPSREKLVEIAGKLQLKSADDITGNILAQADLDKLVGMTGKQLTDAGWVFEGYTMYGGDKTTANFSKDYFSYPFTFNVTVPGDKADTDMDGAGVADAAVAEAPTLVGTNISNDAIDPTKVK